LIKEVINSGKKVSFSNGPRFAGFKAVYKTMKHFPEGKNYVVELSFDSACHMRWTMLPGGWLKLDYDYAPDGQFDYSGITFSYPESKVTGATLMANGPYHVWKNRLKGTQFGVYSKKYNNTVTGESWIYPEFKGYYSNFYAVEIQTKELPVTIVSETNDLFLHLFTPGLAKYSVVRGVNPDVNPPFPDGNISILNGISAIGTKFSKASAEGPQGQKNIYKSERLTATLFFKFGE
jgi:hypothetical protein